MEHNITHNHSCWHLITQLYVERTLVCVALFSLSMAALNKWFNLIVNHHKILDIYRYINMFLLYLKLHSGKFRRLSGDRKTKDGANSFQSYVGSLTSKTAQMEKLSNL